MRWIALAALAALLSGAGCAVDEERHQESVPTEGWTALRDGLYGEQADQEWTPVLAGGWESALADSRAAADSVLDALYLLPLSCDDRLADVAVTELHFFAYRSTLRGAGWLDNLGLSLRLSRLPPETGADALATDSAYMHRIAEIMLNEQRRLALACGNRWLSASDLSGDDILARSAAATEAWRQTAVAANCWFRAEEVTAESSGRSHAFPAEIGSFADDDYDALGRCVQAKPDQWSTSTGWLRHCASARYIADSYIRVGIEALRDAKHALGYDSDTVGAVRGIALSELVVERAESTLRRALVLSEDSYHRLRQTSDVDTAGPFWPGLGHQLCSDQVADSLAAVDELAADTAEMSNSVCAAHASTDPALLDLCAPLQ